MHFCNNDVIILYCPGTSKGSHDLLWSVKGGGVGADILTVNLLGFGSNPTQINFSLGKLLLNGFDLCFSIALPRTACCGTTHECNISAAWLNTLWLLLYYWLLDNVPSSCTALDISLHKNSCRIINDLYLNISVMY